MTDKVTITGASFRPGIAVYATRKQPDGSRKVIGGGMADEHGRVELLIDAGEGAVHIIPVEDSLPPE